MKDTYKWAIRQKIIELLWLIDFDRLNLNVITQIELVVKRNQLLINFWYEFTFA